MFHPVKCSNFKRTFDISTPNPHQCEPKGKYTLMLSFPTHSTNIITAFPALHMVLHGMLL